MYLLRDLSDFDIIVLKSDIFITIIINLCEKFKLQ